MLGYAVPEQLVALLPGGTVPTLPRPGRGKQGCRSACHMLGSVTSWVQGSGRSSQGWRQAPHCIGMVIVLPHIIALACGKHTQCGGFRLQSAQASVRDVWDALLQWPMSQRQRKQHHSSKAAESSAVWTMQRATSLPCA